MTTPLQFLAGAKALQGEGASLPVQLSGSSVDLRGLATDKPLATAVEVGVTYWSVDTGEIEVSDGTTWVAV